MPPSSASLLSLSLAALVLGATLGVLPAAAQQAPRDAAVRVDENVRFEPQGIIVARLQAGTPVRVEATEGSWSRITFEGVVWEPSLQLRDGGSFDLIVSAEEGENLRAEPSGRIVGRLNRGTLLNEVSREGGWIRVRRTAWMWSASLAPAGDGGAAPTPSPQPSPRPTQPPAAGGAPGATPPATPTPGTGAGWIRAGARGTPVLAAPDGDTLAHARSGSELQVVGRQGNWARVRMEGWVWVPGTQAATGGTQTDVIVRDLSASDLSREPDRYRGRLVSLQVQFISLERAEAVRTDFLEGEPFLLARATDASRSFVYLAVPEDRLDEVRRLQPLERLEVVGRVRAGAAALTGNPVLDLVELRRLR
jgi:hypothetical protein